MKMPISQGVASSFILYHIYVKNIFHEFCLLKMQLLYHVPLRTLRHPTQQTQELLLSVHCYSDLFSALILTFPFRAFPIAIKNAHMCIRYKRARHTLIFQTDFTTTQDEFFGLPAYLFVIWPNDCLLVYYTHRHGVFDKDIFPGSATDDAVTKSHVLLRLLNFKTPF